MPIQYVDPALHRQRFGWYSRPIGLDMPIVTYGHAGPPVLLYPTAAADFLENERFFLVKAIEPLLLAGRLRLFSIDSINKNAWMDRDLPVDVQARRQAGYSRYVEDEVVPYIRHCCDDPQARILTTGASFGGFHAANQCFRRPDMFRGVIGMSGFYDLSTRYFKGYSDDNCYWNNPGWFVPDLGGDHLTRLQQDTDIVLASGQGAYEAPDASRRMAGILHDKGIPHWLDIWGADVNHDWPWWRRMLPYFLEKLGF
jgi:esterase/lipase superfamily enzyme